MCMCVTCLTRCRFSTAGIWLAAGIALKMKTCLCKSTGLWVGCGIACASSLSPYHPIIRLTPAPYYPAPTLVFPPTIPVSKPPPPPTPQAQPHTLKFSPTQTSQPPLHSRGQTSPIHSLRAPQLNLAQPPHSCFLPLLHSHSTTYNELFSLSASDGKQRKVQE